MRIEEQPANNDKLKLVVKAMQRENGDSWVEGSIIKKEEFTGLDKGSLWMQVNDFIDRKFKGWRLVGNQEMVFRRSGCYIQQIYQTKANPHHRQSLYVYF